MAEPMRIRAKLNGDIVEVKVLIRHDMETGLRKDPSGKPIPAHFIKALTAKCNEKTVLETVMGIAVSKDPFLSFKFKGGAVGDKVTVTWVDNSGDTRTDEATVS
jgi:sulfur-oxidizing protein SoxZ